MFISVVLRVSLLVLNYREKARETKREGERSLPHPKRKKGGVNGFN